MKGKQIVLIGKKITITESNNKSLEGIRGVVVDETKNTISIECDGKTRKVVKEQCIFDVEGETIDGAEIAKSPEERVKQ
ncbi:ribonuclease P protein subunit [Candidatus Woesearchaeota archaeon]|nr:ribonuclease P protein subunit [Candidatus Woesearchaeota archaeon]